MDGFALTSTRTECWPRYYLIDFGLSRRYNPVHGPPLEDVILGGDKSPPEHAPGNTMGCNPFPTDTYYVGNLLKRYFLNSHSGSLEVRTSNLPPTPTDVNQRGWGSHKPLRFLRPLVDDMTQKDPSKRPTIGEVMQRFDELCGRLNQWQLRKPGQAIHWHEWMGQRYRQLKNTFKHVPPLPTKPPSCSVQLDDRMRAFYTTTPDQI